MSDWDFSPPPATDLHDREVRLEGRHLAGRRVALMVTGGIAAMKAPLVARSLRRQGAEVVAFLSEEGHRYVAVDALEWATTQPVVTRLSPHAEHLSDARPFDAYLVAPATYNTINRVRYGIADGVIPATLASALGRLSRGTARVLVAPTMHGTMHNPILTESLRALAGMGVDVIPPRMENGKHNLPDNEVLVAAVCRVLTRSPLRGRRVLLTTGRPAVTLDGAHDVVRRDDASVGTALAAELHLYGAELVCLHGGGSTLPAWVPHRTLPRAEDLVAAASEAAPGCAAVVLAARIPAAATDLATALRARHPDLPVIEAGGAAVEAVVGALEARVG